MDTLYRVVQMVLTDYTVKFCVVTGSRPFFVWCPGFGCALSRESVHDILIHHPGREDDFGLSGLPGHPRRNDDALALSGAGELGIEEVAHPASSPSSRPSEVVTIMVVRFCSAIRAAVASRRALGLIVLGPEVIAASTLTSSWRASARRPSCPRTIFSSFTTMQVCQ